MVVVNVGLIGFFGIGKGGFDGKVFVVWVVVGILIFWGVWVMF